ncbi:MAG: hypothetical protein HYX86_00515 [Chloroflexi bacterium]|nr:hypothetical protein [Chloroflexota bacterium]
MGKRWFLLIALLGLEACTPAVEPDSGIFGQVLLGPQCPVVMEGQEEECADKPYQATIVVKTEDGSREITRFTSDTNGFFRVALPPGTYLLDPLPGGEPFPFGKPQVVVVEPGKYIEMIIYYDTGIR